MRQKTLLQNFEWYLPDDGQFWRRSAQEAERLAALGFTDVWLPPACKAAGGIHDVGYGCYDLYDLGEFDQKGSVPTKYGTKDDYLAAIRALHGSDIRVLADIVLNHRMGADETEEVMAAADAWNDRRQSCAPPRSIRAWTKFTFPGRQGKYSDFTWNWTHFDGVDWDDRTKQKAVYLFEGKQWDGEVDSENGNFDYLMGADLDMGNPEVLDELDRWGQWYLETTGVDGFRLDAVKHIRFSFYTRWLSRLRERTGRELPSVGEYWHPDAELLCHYLDRSGQVMALFDAPLHFNLQKASNSGGYFDMRHILDGTLVQRRPDLAVTLVDNHDTQPGQALESWVQGWFKPLAYALILLRREGTPCVFYGDLYGVPHDGIGRVDALETLLRARQRCALGRQTDYFDHPDVIGWTRAGLPGEPGSGLAVVLTDGPGGGKLMCVGAAHAGETFADCTGGRPERIVLDECGCARFPVNGGAVSVWVREDLVRELQGA